MKSPGLIMYEDYQAVQQELNSCGTDHWEALEDEDRAAWEVLASKYTKNYIFTGLGSSESCTQGN